MIKRILGMFKIGGLIAIGLSLLVSCSYLDNATDNQPYKGEQASTDINKILAQGAAQNQALEDQGATNIPADVASGLLPNLSIQTMKNAQQTEPRFNISAKEMPARDFFMGLVQGTKYNMVVNPNVQGTVTLNLRNVTIDEALQAVQDNFGYQYQHTAYGYEILPHGLETRTFTVNYLDISRKGESNTTISSGQISQVVSNSSTSGGSSSSLQSSVSPTSKVSTQLETDFWKQLKTTLEDIIGTTDGRKVVLNPEAGIVIARAYPNEFEEVSKYLDSLQSNMAREVILEAKILEVQLLSKYQAGIDWSMLGLESKGESQALTTSSPTITMPAITGNIFTLTTKWGLADFNGIVKLLSAQGNVQTLSSPRIATLNNQMAVIKVGSDEFFVTDVSSTVTGTGSTAQSTQNLDLTPFFSGISLDVVPQIDANGDVILHIHPVVSTVTDQTKTFTVSGESQVLPLALSKIRESDNVVKAKNGQIVVIGGLMQNKTTESKSESPFISKLPIIGSMFKRTDQSLDKTELVILIRPIIVGEQTQTEQVQQAKSNFRKIDRALEPGAKPKLYGAAGREQW